MFQKLLSFLFLSIFIQTVYAQSSADSVQINFTPYGSFRGHLAVFDKEMELQENVSRIGAKVSVKKGKTTFLAASELHLNLFQGGSSFNVDGNPSNDFLDIQTVNTNRAFTNRLGYVGVNFEKIGTFTFGKQWSVYYDITSYTDNFLVFGGAASATYIGGTDGGENGTGRANQSIIYRNSFDRFQVGAQAQVRGGSNDKFVDGFGFSAQYTIIDGLSFGAAMIKDLLSKNLTTESKIIGLTGDPAYYSAGIKYNRKNLTFNVIGAIQKNGDFTQGQYLNTNNELMKPTIVFDAKGLEIYSNYQFKDFSIHAGYNLYIPDTKNIQLQNNQEPISPNFKISNGIIGVRYNPFTFVQIYSEQRLSFGKTVNNTKNPSVFTIGMIIDLSKTFSTKVAAK